MFKIFVNFSSFLRLSPASVLFLHAILAASGLHAQSLDLSSTKLANLIAIDPVEELEANFFPAYLQPAYRKYKTKMFTECISELNKINLNAYSKSSEKLFLLKAFCTKNSDPTAQLNSLNEISKKLLAEKASNSDVLYALALAYAQNAIFDQALLRLQDAKWFNNFNEIKPAQYYYALSRVQLALQSFGEANNSAIEAKKYNLKDQKFNLILIECKLVLSDKKAALLLIKDLKGYPEKVINAYQIRALMLNADPIFHKKDILEASELVKKLSLSCADNKDLAVPAIKSLLYTKNFALAQQISTKALSLEPADAVLVSLKEQAFREM